MLDTPAVMHASLFMGACVLHLLPWGCCTYLCIQGNIQLIVLLPICILSGDTQALLLYLHCHALRRQVLRQHTDFHSSRRLEELVPVLALELALLGRPCYRCFGVLLPLHGSQQRFEVVACLKLVMIRKHPIKRAVKEPLAEVLPWRVGNPGLWHERHPFAS